MDSHSDAENPESGASQGPQEQLPARRKVLRVVRRSTDAPSIRGKGVSQRRDPAKSRRFREMAKSDRAEVTTSDLRRFLTEWLAFQKRVGSLLRSDSEELGGGVAVKDDDEEKRRRRKRIYSPTEPTDLKDPPKPPTYRPEIARGKLYFNCPACLFPTAVFANCAGKTTRCPRCFSAILAPDPENGIEGENLNNDVKALLHPEEFIGVIPKRRALDNVIPLPPLNTAFIASGIAIIAAAVVGAGGIIMRKAHESPAPIVASLAEDAPQLDIEDLHTRAELLVADFLAARGWYEKSRFVRDRQRVAPLMETFYRHHPDDKAISAQRHHVTAENSGFYDHLPGDSKYTRVRVRDHLGGRSDFIVEHLPDGDYIEWESSVGYNPKPLNRLLAASADNAGAIRTLRVLASPDDYFNFRYNSEFQFACVRVLDPQDPEFTGYAYVDRTGPGFNRLKNLLKGATPENPAALMLEVAIAEDAAQTRQMEVVSVVSDHWRLDNPVRADNARFLADGVTPPTPVEE